MSAYAREPERHEHGYAEPMPPEERSSPPTAAGLAVRVCLPVLGAAAMIVAAFLPWMNGADGTTIPAEAFWSTTAEGGSTFVTSAGFVAIVLGLVALVGLAPRSGALTSLAGALMIVAMVLLGITLYRAEAGLDPVETGAWLCLAGGIVALVGGFFGPRPEVVQHITTAEDRPAGYVR